MQVDHAKAEAKIAKAMFGKAAASEKQEKEAMFGILG